MDGASLTVQGAFMGAGIDVRQDETLNIYAQRCGTGRLTAVGGYNGAGIGGGSSKQGGKVTINGGIGLLHHRRERDEGGVGVVGR